MLSKLLRNSCHKSWGRNPKIYLPRFVEKENSKDYSTKETVKFIWPYLFPIDKKIRQITWTTVGLLFANKSLNAYVPFILKDAIDSLSVASPELFYSGSIFVAYAMSRALVTGINELRAAMFSHVLSNAMKEVSTKVFAHLHTLDYIFHQESTRLTLYSVDRSMRGIESYLKFSMLYIIPTLFEFLLASGVVVYSCGMPYFYTLGGTVGSYYIFTIKYTEYRNKTIREQKQRNKALDFVINESMTNYETVKYMNNENLEKERYSYYLERKLQGILKITRSLSILNFGQQFIFNAGLGINLLLAVSQVQAGTMTVGDIFLIQSLFLSLQAPLNLMGTIYREIIESQVEINDLLGILDIKSRVQESSTAIDYQYKGGRIQISDLEYNVGKKIFENLNLDIEPGTTNAFVGESGCGKSTLFRLMYRLVDPPSGKILLDGQGLKDLKLDSFRKLFTIVPQTPVLFNDTIYYNVSYGNPKASREEVEQACKLANIHNRIIEFPQGYDSLVGELGSKLSGGERQRLILARGLLRESKIILLDEFTSAMDSNNEQEILQTLKKVIKGKTVIFNSHRLSTTMFVDKIFVIDGGKICESGTHEELLRNENSKYFELWNQFIKKGV